MRRSRSVRRAVGSAAAAAAFATNASEGFLGAPDAAPEQERGRDGDEKVDGGHREVVRHHRPPRRRRRQRARGGAKHVGSGGRAVEGPCVVAGPAAQGVEEWRRSDEEQQRQSGADGGEEVGGRLDEGAAQVRADGRLPRPLELRALLAHREAVHDGEERGGGGERRRQPLGWREEPRDDRRCAEHREEEEERERRKDEAEHADVSGSHTRVRLSSFVTCGAVSDTSLCSGKHTARKSALSARRSQVRRMRTNGRSSLIV